MSKRLNRPITSRKHRNLPGTTDETGRKARNFHKFFHSCGKLGEAAQPGGSCQHTRRSRAANLPQRLAGGERFRQTTAPARSPRDARGVPLVIDTAGIGSLVLWVHSVHLRNRAFRWKRGDSRHPNETDLSTQPPPPQEGARISGQDEHQERAIGAEAAPRQGTQAPERF